MSDCPNCPRCGNPGVVIGPKLFRCTNCKGLFDDDPEEGGVHGNRAESLAMLNEKEAEKKRRIHGKRVNEQLRRFAIDDKKRRR